MNNSIHLWLRYLLYLAGSLSLLSIVILIVKIVLREKGKHAMNLDSYWRKINENLNSPKNLSLMNRVSLVTVGVLFGVISGYMWGVVQQFNRMRTAHDLVISLPVSDKVYRYTTNHVEYQTTFCYPIHFNQGDYIQWITYEDKSEDGCWMPKSYYINRERSLYGRNSNTYSNAHAYTNPNTYAGSR